MKIIHSADQHLGYEPRLRPFDGYIAFEAFLQYCKEHPKYPVIIAGDLFDSLTPNPRAYYYALMLQYLINDVYIVRGNHDDDDDLTNTPLQILHGHKNIHIIDKKCILPVGDAQVLFLPPSKETEFVKAASNVDIVVAHGRYVDEETYRGVGPFLDFSFLSENVKYVALGDLHFNITYQSRIHYSGAPWRMTFAQEYKKCGFLLIDTKTWDTPQFVELPSRQFVTITKVPTEATIEQCKDAVVRIVFDPEIHTQAHIDKLRAVALDVRVLKTRQEVIVVDTKARTTQLYDLLIEYLTQRNQKDLIPIVTKYWDKHKKEKSI